MESVKQTCTRCKLNLPCDDNFKLNKLNQYQKQCNACNDKCRINKTLTKLRKSLNKEYDEKFIKLKIIINKDIVKQSIENIPAKINIIIVEDESQITQQCSDCRVTQIIDGNFEFKKINIYFKTCNTCRLKRTCPHGKRKSHCKDCGGGKKCSHDESSKTEIGCKECNAIRRINKKRVKINNIIKQLIINIDDKLINNKILINEDIINRKYVISEQTNDDIVKQRCTRCKLNLQIDKYFNIRKDNDSYKTCNNCRSQYLCFHGTNKSDCRQCDNSNRYCIHNRRKEICTECGTGTGLCIHNVRRSRCKQCIDLGPSELCIHKQYKRTCIKCGTGTGLCIHNIQRQRCIPCQGCSLCKHNIEKRRCRECGGNDFCLLHNRCKYTCKECNGSSVCNHGRIKSTCTLCPVEVAGTICEHRCRRMRCKICNFQGYLASIVSSQVHHALQNDKSKRSIEYLGCTIDEFKTHIEANFTKENGFTWDTHGEIWHIDHIIPLKYEEPSLEELFERLHFSNTQPMLASDNISKGNRFIG
jgi:ribosomal protein L31E